MVDYQSLVISFTIAAMVVSVVVWLVGLRRDILRDKEVEPLLKKQKKEREERRKLIGLDSPRIPLYFDTEQLGSLFSQSKMRNSSMEIDSVKLVKQIESDLKVDTKLASTGAKKSETAEVNLKEFESMENMYETVVKWLSDANLIITGLEEPAEFVQEIGNFKISYSAKALKIANNVSKELQELVVKLREMGLEYLIGEMESLLNKIVFIKGNFLVREIGEKDFVLSLERYVEFYVNGLTEYCSKTGKETLTVGTEIKASVFGYVSNLDRENHSIMITPMAINRLIS